MIKFFQKKQGVRDFSILEVDMHSHLLPGIDDGAKDMEDSLFLIGELKSLGYREIITTPHIHYEYYPNTKEIILSKLEDLKEELVNRKIDIEISASAEYFIDEHFEELLDSGELLPFKNNYLLVEQSFFAETPGIDEILFKIQTKGFQPILAHPERYTYWGNHFERYEQLKEQGVLLQVNLLSLSGNYGKTVQKIAHRLIENNMVSFLGTDLHNSNHILKLKKLLADKKLHKILNQNWQNKALHSLTLNAS